MEHHLLEILEGPKIFVFEDIHSAIVIILLEMILSLKKVSSCQYLNSSTSGR